MYKGICINVIRGYLGCLWTTTRPLIALPAATSNINGRLRYQKHLVCSSIFVVYRDSTAVGDNKPRGSKTHDATQITEAFHR